MTKIRPKSLITSVKFGISADLHYLCIQNKKDKHDSLYSRETECSS